MKNTHQFERTRLERRGIALIPTLLIVSAMTVFVMALFSAVLAGKKTTNLHTDDYELSSAVESVAMLATERLWSDYLASEGGAAGNIGSFRDFLSDQGIAADAGSQPPTREQGFDLLPLLDLPVVRGTPTFNNVRIESMRVVRRDVATSDSTQLWITVQAATNRGLGIVNPVLNRAVQQVWTVEPEQFAGFDYAMLANNVNCIFCHTQVDSVERWFNQNSEDYGTFDRIKVGTLESLMLRHDMMGVNSSVNDMDADAVIAGTLYSRGPAMLHDGSPISNWSDLTLQSFGFDSEGRVLEDQWGGESLVPLAPAGDPPQPLENLYVGYSSDYSSMVDGNLPTEFPPPIPDNGGIDPVSGARTTAGAGDRVIDDNEFFAVAMQAEGAITAGVLNLSPHNASPIDTVSEYSHAVFTGNQSSLQQSVEGNVILTGTATNPITIDGTVAIDGDLVINGYVKGEGTLVVRGNVYIPTDVQYLDGADSNGNRTFGLAADGTTNALALSAGGNVVIGDYQRPSGYASGSSEIVTGSPNAAASGNEVNAWNFSLAEMALFNRGEWSRTQEFLPGPNGAMVPNPHYATYNDPGSGELYVPRYYRYGVDDVVPIYNVGTTITDGSGNHVSHFYDPALDTWISDSNIPAWEVYAEVPLDWNSLFLNTLDPSDPNEADLFDAGGNPIAVIREITPGGGWISDAMYKEGVRYFEASVHPHGEPMKIDGLLYTNNGIFTLVARDSPMFGRMVLNGGIVAADLGMLVPGKYDPTNALSNQSALSDYAVGLQLNYDKRLKELLTIANPLQVQLRRTLWNPTSNLQ
ncbi:MAG: hypothetical protein WD226_08870 [Planctomycetota bacterium]